MPQVSNGAKRVAKGAGALAIALSLVAAVEGLVTSTYPDVSDDGGWGL